jgi:hypothetical protein
MGKKHEAITRWKVSELPSFQKEDKREVATSITTQDVVSKRTSSHEL